MIEPLLLDTKLTNHQHKSLVDFYNDYEKNINEWVYYDNTHLLKDTKTSIYSRGRKALMLDNISNLKLEQTLQEIKENIFKSNNFNKDKFKEIKNMEPDSALYPTLFSCIYSTSLQEGVGRGVHTHNDPRGQNNEIQVRFNFLVQKSAEGGEPVVNSRLINLTEKDGMILFASEWKHSAMPVQGNTARVLLSIGYLVDYDYAKELEKRFVSRND